MCVDVGVCVWTWVSAGGCFAGVCAKEQPVMDETGPTVPSKGNRNNCLELEVSANVLKNFNLLQSKKK